MNTIQRPTSLRKGQLWKSDTNLILIVEQDCQPHILWIDTDSFHMSVSVSPVDILSLKSHTYVGTLDIAWSTDLISRMATL